MDKIRNDIEKIESLLENIPIAAAKVGVGDTIEILQANGQYYQIFGTKSSDYKTGAFARFGEADRRVYEAYIKQRTQDKEDIFLEYKTTHKETEKTVWVRVQAHYIGEEKRKSGMCAVYLATYADITKQKQMAAEIEEIKSLYLRAISSSDEVIFDYLIEEDVFTYYKVIDDNGKITNQSYVKENFLANSGKEKFIYPDDLVYFYDLCRENINHPFDIRICRSRNNPEEYTRMRVHASLQKDADGRPARVIGTARPILPSDYLGKSSELGEKVDELTGLNSRKMAQKLIEEYKANSSVAVSYALLILDIKDFRKVNDAYGHIFGDNVLVQVADIIIENIQRSDIAARLGGDEFLIFIKNVSERSIIRLCNKVCRAIKDIYVGEDLKIDACIGAVFSKDPRVAYTDLLQTADDALFELITTDKTGVNVAKEISYHNKGLRLSYVADRNLRKETAGKDEKRLSELIFELLEKAKDINRAINTVLALVGEKQNLSRITIMQRKGMELEVTYQWTARGITANPTVDGNIILEYQKNMRENFTEDGMGIIDERTVANYNNSKKDILLPAGCKSLMYCDMLEFGEPTGMIAYVDCTGNKEWQDKDFKSFRTITRLISAYTLKARAFNKE